MRAPAAESNFCDVQAPPSFATFCVVICLSVEWRVFPQSPLTAGHCLPAGARASSPDCTATPAGRMRRHAAVASTSLMQVIELLLAAQMILQEVHVFSDSTHAEVAYSQPAAGFMVPVPE